SKWSVFLSVSRTVPGVSASPCSTKPNLDEKAVTWPRQRALWRRRPARDVIRAASRRPERSVVMLRRVILASFLATAASAANFGPGFKQQAVPVEGCTLNATIGGNGPTVLLLHGYAEAAQMWKPLAIKLAPKFTVVAIDLPGIGDSSIPASGIDMKTSAQRIH